MLGVVAAVLREHDAQGWLVGGSVRDRELGRFSPDIDVVVTGDACAISRGVARSLGVPWFALSDEFRAYRVVGEASHVDVAAVRGGDILTDLGERDFTVNAMALPIGDGGSLGDLIDPFAGLADLRAMRLRAVSERVFSDDPLRLMRAARFAHVFGLQFDPTLRQAVHKQAAEIERAAPERTLTEMILTLDAGRAGDAVRLWEGLGLLRALVPEVGGTRGYRDAVRLPRPSGGDPGRSLIGVPRGRRSIGGPSGRAGGRSLRPPDRSQAGRTAAERRSKPGAQGRAPAEAVRPDDVVRRNGRTDVPLGVPTRAGAIRRPPRPGSGALSVGGGAVGAGGHPSRGGRLAGLSCGRRLRRGRAHGGLGGPGRVRSPQPALRRQRAHDGVGARTGAALG